MINPNYILLGFTLLISAYIVYVGVRNLIETKKRYLQQKIMGDNEQRVLRIAQNSLCDEAEALHILQQFSRTPANADEVEKSIIENANKGYSGSRLIYEIRIAVL